MKYQHILLLINFTRIIKGLGTSWQSLKLGQKDVGDVYHNLHYPPAKFHFDTSRDSREITKEVACNIHWSAPSGTLELEDLRKTLKSKYRENETLFSLRIKKLVHCRLRDKL